MDNIAVSSGKTNASSFFNNNTTNNISFDSNNKISGNNVEKISNSFRQNLSDVESIDVLSNVNKNTILNTNSTDDMITRNGVLNSWISYIKTTLDDLVYQKQQTIENYYNKFNQTHFSDLIVNQETGEYLTPEEYKKSSETLESFLIQNGYPTSDGVDPDLYLKGVEAFNNYVDTEYTELFNKHFEEATGISYDEYVLKINTFDQDITNLKSNLYAFEQQAKEEPYLEMIETDEYKKFYEDNPDLLNEINSIYDSGKYKIFNDSLYVDASQIPKDYMYNGNDNTVTIDGKIYYKYQSPDEYKNNVDLLNAFLEQNGYTTDPAFDPIEYNKGVDEFNKYVDKMFGSGFNYEFLYSMINTKDAAYLTDEEKQIYIYLLSNKSNEEASEYIKAIEDKINQRKGQEEANEFIASITDEDGNINYNVLSGLLANGKGILSGIETFGEGLANVFRTEGIMSDNQYAQMYIIEALTNTSGAYVNSLAESILSDKGEEACNEFLENMINVKTGEINLDYAKTVLTNVEYQNLEEKINKDKNTLLDDAFQFGSSFGNMLPSMACTFVLSSIGAAPMATSLIGNLLMGFSAGGNAKNQALVSGNDLLSSTIYGVLSGTSETCLGMLLGNIPGLNTNASLSLKGIFSEGFEEFSQEYVDAGLRCALLGETIDIDQLGPDSLKSFVYGCLMSFGLNSATMGVKLAVNGSTVELKSLSDFKSFFKILNDSSIILNDNNQTGTKDIIVDDSITNKSEMVEMISKIFKDSDVYVKTDNGLVSYEGYNVDTMNSSIVENINTSETDTSGLDDNANIDNSSDISEISQTVVTNDIPSSVSETILNATDTVDSFGSFIDKVIKMDGNTLPEGFTSVEEYKNFVVDTLVNSGKIETLNNAYIGSLIKDPILFTRLLSTEIGSSKIDNLIIKDDNLVDCISMLAPAFNNLTVEQFCDVFNSPVVKEYVENLSFKDFKNVVIGLSRVNSYFSQSSVFIEKLESMNINDFYDVINNIYSLYSEEIPNSTDHSNYCSFLRYVYENFATSDILMNNTKYIYIIDNVLFNPYKVEDAEVNELITKIKNNGKNAESTLYNKIAMNAPELLSFNGYSLSYIEDVDPNCYYDIIFELDGKVSTKSVISTRTKLNLKENLTRDMLSAAYNDKFKILNIKKNDVKSSLYLTKNDGVSDGINKIKLIIDGKEKSILKKSNYGPIVDLNNVISDYNNVDVVSVEPIQSQDLIVSDVTSIYEISYLDLIDSEVKKFYLSPNSYGKLQIDEYLISNDIVDFSDINVKSVALSDIKLNFDFVNSKSGVDIYSKNKYGGAQGDVFNIIKDSILGNTQSDIDLLKASLLKNIITNYYPNITDVEMINLCEVYAKSGCGYMALANTIATYIGNLENGASIFKERFGYDLYIEAGGKKIYNLEAIALDLFLNYRFTNSVEQIINSSRLGLSAAFNDYYTAAYKFLYPKGFDVYSDFCQVGSTNIKNNLVTDIANFGGSSFKILNASQFNLNLVNNAAEILESDAALTNSSISNNKIENIGGHAMVVTGINIDGNLLVSSWSKMCSFDSESFQNRINQGNLGGRLGVTSISYGIR